MKNCSPPSRNFSGNIRSIGWGDSITRERDRSCFCRPFFKEIVNSGGQIHREYGLGRKRTGLMILWKHETGVQKIVLELKILRKSLERTVEEGCAQLADYLDKCGADEGHLIVFDITRDKPWEEKIFRREESFENQKIHVWGM